MSDSEFLDQVYAPPHTHTHPSTYPGPTRYAQFFKDKTQGQRDNAILENIQHVDCMDDDGEHLVLMYDKELLKLGGPDTDPRGEARGHFHPHQRKVATDEKRRRDAWIPAATTNTKDKTPKWDANDTYAADTACVLTITCGDGIIYFYAFLTTAAAADPREVHSFATMKLSRKKELFHLPGPTVPATDLEREIDTATLRGSYTATQHRMHKRTVHRSSDGSAREIPAHDIRSILKVFLVLRC